jgi:hypothetical protein
MLIKNIIQNKEKNEIGRFFFSNTKTLTGREIGGLTY